MADGYTELTLEQLKTPEGINQINRMLRTIYDNISGDTESVRIFNGYGSPEGVVTAGVGSVYMRIDGSTGTSLYSKESGTENTGWVAISGSTPITLPLSVANGGTGEDNSAVVQGVIPYFSATGVISGLATGTSGYFLKTQGAGADPIWAAQSVSALTLLSTTTFTGAATSGSITISPGKTYKIFGKFSTATNGQTATILINGDSGTNYQRVGTSAAGSANILTTGSTLGSGFDCTLIMDIVPVQTDPKYAFVEARLLYKGSGSGTYDSLTTSTLYLGASTLVSYILNFSGTNGTGTIWTYEYSGT